MLWATFAAALGAIISAAVGYLLYRTSTDPHVIVYTALSPKIPTVILVVIENIGRGPAKNVRFSLGGPVPWKAWGIEEAQAFQPMDRGPLITGIPFLAPGARREFTWGQFGGLHAAIGDGAVKVTATYLPDGRDPLAPHEFVTESLLEVKSFHHTNDDGNNAPKDIAEQLRRIADATAHASIGFRPLHVQLKDQKPHPRPDAG